MTSERCAPAACLIRPCCLPHNFRSLAQGGLQGRFMVDRIAGGINRIGKHDRIGELNAGSRLELKPREFQVASRAHQRNLGIGDIHLGLGHREFRLPAHFEERLCLNELIPYQSEDSSLTVSSCFWRI